MPCNTLTLAAGGRVRDFHPIGTEHAGRAQKKGALAISGLPLLADPKTGFSEGTIQDT